VRRCERNNSADTKVSEEGGGGRGLRCQSREFSLAARAEDHGEVACPLAVHGGPRWSRYPPAARGRGPHAGAGGCLKEAVTLGGARTGAGSCQDLRSREERSLCWSRCVGRACDPVGTHTGAACS